MSWLTKLFGYTNNERFTTNNKAPEAMSENNINVLEDMFVNNNPPTQANELAKEDNVNLKTYLEQDFFRKGYDEGYNWHSSEMLDSRLKGIKADFRYNLKLKIDACKVEILKFENHKVKIEGMSEIMAKQLDNQLAAIRETINELEVEIALATLDEGLVMISIYQYRNGFILGTEAFQEEKLIAGSTGMF
ncbi:MAG: hypothetical protein ACOH2V_13020 [Candidatus Saccharimonadaceae bacterium]